MAWTGSGSLPADALELLPKYAHFLLSSHPQVLHFVRHGETEMNVHLAYCKPSYGQPGFVDPLLFDTRLTAHGHRQASATAAAVARLRPTPQLVVVSPLTRALQTAAASFAGIDVPLLAHPLARERLYLSSDVGRPRRQLEAEHPAVDFSHLPVANGGPDAVWWHSSLDEAPGMDEGADLGSIEEEPEGAAAGASGFSHWSGEAMWLQYVME